jgi:hypothetical protein
MVVSANARLAEFAGERKTLGRCGVGVAVYGALLTKNMRINKRIEGRLAQGVLRLRTDGQRRI